jgi:hypothetical protein
MDIMKTSLNLIGIYLGVIVFLAIGAGHVLVRKIDYHFSNTWIVSLAFFIAGLVAVGLSFLVDSEILSGFLGVLGIIVFWDGIELIHQEKRVIKGHAPANPKNPRHQRILQKYPAATTNNPLDQVDLDKES